MTRHRKYTTVYVVPERSSQTSSLSCLHGVGCGEISADDVEPQPRHAVSSSHHRTRTHRTRSSRHGGSSQPLPNECQRSVTPAQTRIVDDWLDELPYCPTPHDSSVDAESSARRVSAPGRTELLTSVPRVDHIPRYPRELGPQSAEALMTNHGARPPLRDDSDTGTIIVVTQESRTRPPSAGHYRPRHSSLASSDRRRHGSVGSKHP